MTRHILLDKLLYLALVHAALRVHDDVGARGFGALGDVDADDGRVEDLGVGDEERFELGGGDL